MFSWSNLSIGVKIAIVVAVIIVIALIIILVINLIKSNKKKKEDEHIEKFESGNIYPTANGGNAIAEFCSAWIQSIKDTIKGTKKQ